MKIYNWRPFLDRWRADECAARDASGEVPGPDASGAEAGELGFPPADAARVGALEERLGVALPPSFRSFLAASDGWRPVGTGIGLLGTSEGVRWHDGAELTAVHEAALDEESSEEEVLTAGMWSRALQLAVESGMTDVLLDPGDVDGGGEWAAYVYRARSGRLPQRYTSFLDLMQGLFRASQLHWSERLGAAYVSQTTREFDADADDARRALLAGEDVDTWLPALSEAAEHGRPRARVLYAQVEALLDPCPRSHPAAAVPGWLRAVAPAWDDPLLVREFLPLAAWALTAHASAADPDVVAGLSSAAGPSSAAVPADGADGSGAEERRAVIASTLRAVRERTYRYEAAGRFGEAADAAREQARWGDTDGAWRTLAAALPAWQPYGPDQVAPVGLLADPVLGPLITPERGRHVLRTAGAAEGGDPAARRDEGTGTDTEDGGAGDSDVPDGLSWLVDEDLHHPSGYRFLCVEGTEPTALADRLGGGPLPVPYGASDVSRDRSAGRPVPVRLGDAGGGWSFAFDSGPGEDVDAARPAGPGVDASPAGGGREVDVRVERSVGSCGPEDAFHFSVAREGRAVHGFAWRGGRVEQWGEAPAALDPATLFQAKDRTLDPDDEYEALLAIGSAFGISLPRFALTRGRLVAAVPTAWPLPSSPDGPRPMVGRHAEG